MVTLSEESFRHQLKKIGSILVIFTERDSKNDNWDGKNEFRDFLGVTRKILPWLSY